MVGGDSVHPRGARGRGRAVVVLVVVATVLAGCASISDETVDELSAMPGIERASASCPKGVCSLRLLAEPGAEAGDLTAALETAREVEASELQLDLREGSGLDAGGAAVAIVLAEASDPSADGAAVALAQTMFASDGLRSGRVQGDRDGTTVVVSSDVSRAQLWDLAESVWPGAAELPKPTVQATTSGGDGEGPSRLTSEGRFPADGVELVRALDDAEVDRSGLSGALVQDGTVLLGARSLESAARLENRLEADSLGEGLDVSVSVTDNVLSYRPDSAEGGTEQQRRAVLTALQEDGSLTGGVDTSGVTAIATDAESAATAVDRAREAEPEAAGVVSITIDLDGMQAELGTTGSPDLVRLLGLFASEPTTTTATVEVPRNPQDPPFDAEANLALEVEASDLTAGVQAAAEQFAGWDGPERKLRVSITAVDPEGRTPGVSLIVERRDGVWEAGPTERGTPELVAEGVSAWTAGIDAAAS